MRLFTTSTPLAPHGAALLALGLLGCSSVGLKSGAGTDAGVPPPGTSDASAADAPTGAGCGVDPASGVTLCTSVSTCPQLAVDHDLYPDCGFRVRAGTLDIECACSGELCPLGVASTCTEAKQLLAQQSELAVCQQVNDGRCTGGGGPVDSGPASTCDPTCRDSCVGDPTCIQSCGC
jgi:hypothetical protein